MRRSLRRCLENKRARPRGIQPHGRVEYGALENSSLELGHCRHHVVSAPHHETGHLRILIANERRDRHAVDADAALEMLREHSQRNSNKLTGVAEAIVESHRLLMPAIAQAPAENM